MPRPFIYINGWPGVGKHTIACALKTLLSRHGPVKVVSDSRHAVVSALSAFLHSFVSQAILTPHTTRKQIHNHLHIDLAGALLDRSHPGYQTLRRHLRSVLFDTLATDPDTFDTTYIFTDFTTANDLGTSVANEYAAAAQARGCAFIPVVLTCAVVENARRMRSPERVELVRTGKGLLLDTALLETMRGVQGLFRFERKEELVWDVGGLEVEEAAGVVAGHVQWVGGWMGGG